jgi:hypothetical protein
MHESLRCALQKRRPQIRARWEALLRLERPQTPLGNPDTLVFMFDQTLDEVLAALPARSTGVVRPRTECQCDCNPMRVYFPALEQALLEALVLVQSEQPALSAEERVDDVAELCGTLRQVARREIAAFDGLCQQKTRSH